MDTPKVKVSVSWPTEDTVEWYLTYPRVGEFVMDNHGDLWEVTRVTQVGVPKAEYIVTVDKPQQQP
ncbi:hypothetical protein [Streptomyces sp. 135]|uniref:hypothetical protein n=1 Tax=Streptomyces sp. 135 TaxID=2838850 RepID=UPI001CC0F9B4|nr:hypothetical protein [Streptomyces sp. 135]